MSGAGAVGALAAVPDSPSGLGAPREGRLPTQPRPRHTILICSDFFFPNYGGVEQHMFQLAQFLMKRGHKVVVMTHAYDERSGVRWMTGGLKVYYVPMLPFYNKNTFPILWGCFPIFRDIVLRERIDIVHCHQAFSTIAHEAIMHAGTMGCHTVFTDHSLFGFRDASGILMNKLLKFTLSNISHVICVSHTGKENTVLRARLNHSDVSVIPNAVDCSAFTPDISARPDHRDRVNIVIISRLVYRKGMDLVAKVMPMMCERYPQVHFIIGGDGPKKLLLEETVQKHQLHDRVEFLGAVPSSGVRDVLIRGHIFLNCSLTEAFCIAILEAASCGLLVVATKVGGVPEVLPPDMIVFSAPSASDLCRALGESMPRIPTIDSLDFHRRVRAMYSWEDVAERTERVYHRIYRQPRLPLIERFRRYYGCGPFAGKLFVCVVATSYLIWHLLEWLRPRSEIDLAVDYFPGGADGSGFPHHCAEEAAAAAAAAAATSGRKPPTKQQQQQQQQQRQRRRRSKSSRSLSRQGSSGRGGEGGGGAAAVAQTTGSGNPPMAGGQQLAAAAGRAGDSASDSGGDGGGDPQWAASSDGEMQQQGQGQGQDV
jgi:phosphatidylinositol glycan class A protein